MVIFVDLVLSGDNAIVIGMAAAALPLGLRKKAIFWGIAIAVILRIILAALTFYLLQLVGIKLIGGLLLIAVCYFMWKDLSYSNHKSRSPSTKDPLTQNDNASEDHPISASTALSSSEFRKALLKITIADLTMSLDNVLAVAGIARENIFVLVFGLALSIVLMAVGASMVAKMLEKHTWLGYLGLLIIFYVACDMAYDGSIELIQFTEQQV